MTNDNDDGSLAEIGEDDAWPPVFDFGQVVGRPEFFDQ